MPETSVGGGCCCGTDGVCAARVTRWAVRALGACQEAARRGRRWAAQCWAWRVLMAGERGWADGERAGETVRHAACDESESRESLVDPPRVRGAMT